MNRYLQSLFTAAIIFLSTTGSNAQNYFPDTAWTRCYGGSMNEYGRYIANTSDGGYIILADGYSIDGDLTGAQAGYKQWIFKLDSLGNIQWSKFYPYSYNTHAENIKQTPDEGYVIGGDQFTKLKPNGDIDWQVPVPCHYVLSTYDGGYAALNCVAHIFVPGTLKKLNSQGAQQWSQDIWYVTAHSLEQTIDSGFLISGSYYVEGPGFWFSWYNEYDQNGVSMMNGGGQFGSFSAAKQTLDKKAIATGCENEWAMDSYGLLSKRDSDITWMNQYWDNLPADVIANVDTTYVFCGIDTFDDAFIAKTTATGNQTAIRIFGGSAQDNFHHLLPTRDSGYIVLGTTRSNDGDIWGLHDSADVWVVKFKKDTSVHVPPVVLSANTISRIEEVKVYPTLSNGTVNVLLPEGVKEVGFEMYNIVGEAVKVKTFGAGNKRTIQIDQPAGQYILRVYMEGEQKSFPVILMP